ncbi:MAG: hypothetical protein VKK04_18890 [Synechococcales bacterium]|nr:hypothetical protein [Synechococcales bacterium]
MRLSPMMSYYIRQIVRQHSSEFVNSTEGAPDLKGDVMTDLNAVLRYRYSHNREIYAAATQLENLAQTHHALRHQSLHTDYSGELAALEAKIFSILGFQRCQ